MNDTQIIDKIRKMLALAGSANENEAALAAEKAQDWCLKHGIDLATVAMADGEDDVIGVDDIKTEQEKIDPWARSLAVSVSKNMGGRVIRLPAYNGKHQSRLHFFGPNAQAMVDLWRYLVAQLTTISAIEAANRVDTSVHGRRWRSSFLSGAVNRIDRRLEERKEKTEMESDTSMALMVLHDAVDRAVGTEYENLSTKKNYKRIHGGAYEAGKAAGGRVSFGDGRVRRGGQHRLSK